VLLWVFVAWLVVVGTTVTLASVRGVALYRRVRTAEGELRVQVEALERAGLTTLASRTAELQRQLEALREAMDRLNRSMEALRVLMAAWNSAIGPVRFVLKFLRR
jgi:lipid A disaccharide synthetase